MKKSYKLLAILFALSLTVTACGGSSMGAMDTAVTEEYKAEENGYYDEVVEESVADSATGVSGTGEIGNTAQTNRKLIRTFDISIQTKEFDAVLSGIQAKVQELGGYIEQSSLDSGSAYYTNYNRYSNMTVRIPSEKLDQFVENVKSSANVTNISETADDITLKYVDVESRKIALETERDRLLELLEKAETVEDIITIESRLSEVRYELEAYASTLRTMDNQVDYSTVHLNIREVDRETKVEPKGFWDEVKEEFGDSIYGVTNGAKNFAIWLLGSSPYLILWAVLIGVVIFVFKYLKKKKELKKLFIQSPQDFCESDEEKTEEMTEEMTQD